MLPNVAEFPMAYYGVLRAGGVAVPMNPLLKAREVTYHLGDSEARLTFAWHQFASEASDGARQAGAQAIIVDPAGFKNLLASAIPDHQLAGRDD
jgi:long-chain acyl-CoA synthetase